MNFKQWLRFHRLPVWKHRKEILSALRYHNVVIVESPTGSGKTTQLPLILYQEGYANNGLIGVTQPRRIATLSISEYIARYLNCQDRLVAYKMRFDDTTDRSTKIKIVTDGTLLQEMKHDPDLLAYNALIVDEAHERTLTIDFILGLLKKILMRRPNFRVIISSATINAQMFADYFNQAPKIYINAPVYPVDVIYRPIEADTFMQRAELVNAAIASIVTEQVAVKKKRGDILVFLPGEAMIKDAAKTLLALPFSKKLLIIPLYARLGKKQQDLALRPTPSGMIKITLATNIAETSLTIDGIETVIDSGLAKISFYNAASHTAALVEDAVSRASADQRKGRAGRTRPGVCYRLYSQQEHANRPEFTRPEIFRTDLSEVVLRMAELNIKEFNDFDFIAPPGAQAISEAVDELHIFKALAPDLSLSRIGVNMAIFPLLPAHARIVVEAMMRYPNVLADTITGVAFLTSNTPFIIPAGEEEAARAAHKIFRHNEGDFVAYLNIIKAYERAADKAKFCSSHYLDPMTMNEIWHVRRQLQDIVIEQGRAIRSDGNRKHYMLTVMSGLILRACIDIGSREGYASLTTRNIVIHPGSLLAGSKPKFIVAGEIVRTSRTYARAVGAIKQEWLREIAPDIHRRLVNLSHRAKSESKSQGKGKGRSRHTKASSRRVARRK